MANMDDVLDTTEISQPTMSIDQPGPTEPKSRKRTKTGCLTCRKRRIKCGEERPICSNCVKSKRNCEGYAPRLTFKDPMGAYAQSWVGRRYPPGQMLYMPQTMAAAGHPQFPLIAPRPIPLQSYYRGNNYPPDYLAQDEQLLHHGQQNQDSASSRHSLPPQGHPRSQPDISSQNHVSSGSQESGSQTAQTSVKRELSPAGPIRYEPRLPETSVTPSSYLPIQADSMGIFRSLPPDWHEKTPPPQSAPRLTTARDDHDGWDQQHPAMAQLDEDGEYYDVDSDEEMQDAESPTLATTEKRRRDLSYVLTISGQGRNLRSVEAFLNQPNVLTTYAPKFSSSPLMDEATARIFCHFVTVIGPLLSAYGRHPVNPALLFSGKAVPKSQQALWTYTIPMMAITNQALLHAVLALSSLNIARLQQTPLTVPIKHYQFALRRVAKAVATPGKRTAMATVAATILLSQFEILSAEYSKWHSHLAGARQLLTEINFAKWTDRIHQERDRRRSLADHENTVADLPWIPEPGSEHETIINQLIGTSVRKDFHGHTQKTKGSTNTQSVTEKEMDDFQTYRDLFWMYTKIDNIQSFISGRRLLLPFDRWIHCPPRAPMNRIDAVYGTLDHVALLLGRVADFAGKDVVRKRKAVKANGGVWRPPPGMFGPPGSGSPAGMPSAANNGMPSMPSPPGAASLTPQRTPETQIQAQQLSTPSSSTSQPSTPGQGPPSSVTSSGPPTFSGMMPSESEPSTTMPDAFTQAPRDVLYHPIQNESDIGLVEATKTAQAEWDSIQEAFDVFENALGPAFKPLPSDAGPPLDTPFGPAIQYRSFQIAVGWLLFYMAKIISVRTHPAMPPASMVAAGIVAAKTAQYCNIVGKINFGLKTPAPHQPLNPIFAGAITEMMLPMFVAGVQYMDNAQRMATVERLQFIADRIGHDSAAIIAAGLEKTWIRMHEAGRGPPYKPSVRVQDEYGRDLTEHERRQPEDTNRDIRVPRGPTRDFSGRELPKTTSRGAVILQKDTRSFAAGVMGLEEDFGQMNMDDSRPG